MSRYTPGVDVEKDCGFNCAHKDEKNGRTYCCKLNAYLSESEVFQRYYWNKNGTNDCPYYLYKF